MDSLDGVDMSRAESLSHRKDMRGLSSEEAGAASRFRDLDHASAHRRNPERGPIDIEDI